MTYNLLATPSEYQALLKTNDPWLFNKYWKAPTSGPFGTAGFRFAFQQPSTWKKDEAPRMKMGEENIAMAKGTFYSYANVGLVSHPTNQKLMATLFSR